MKRIGCQCKERLDFRLKMAFQPIVDVFKREVISYEALVRGSRGESALEVFKRVNEDNKYSFDQSCRITAIETFARLQSDKCLNINFMPQAIYEPEACLAMTLKTAKKFDIPTNKIIFEVTEQERVVDKNFLISIFDVYKECGFQTAIDDFGEGFAGLSLLCGFQPNYIKLSIELVRSIDTDFAKQTIFKGIQFMCEKLNIQMLAEGVETESEYMYLKAHRVSLMQGYLFAKPELESLPTVYWPSL
ncbi:EAL domain-containing protein [Pseudoalteromonas sp. L23]|uniref:EAL domain-containing protein n=1 Tax=unclassified Pseudoalteromonas TaxID=194690 RepID=UPI001EF0DD52|nr:MULTISPECIES: EAL domain-containing protein [unclassified Pseudoalteromonas]MCF7516487.1 EAL domain-containing protein [Pseudoalteromonas sp. L7]MCF7528540.1 EAL domain-containing protein [Pseudoalteromonas sp. L23]